VALPPAAWLCLSRTLCGPADSGQDTICRGLGTPIERRWMPLIAPTYCCCRYQINAANEEPGRDWSPAAVHYRQAALVLPAGGNAHNQLAVLAT